MLLIRETKRMARIDIAAIRKIEDPEERYNTALRIFEDARAEASKEISAELDSKGIPRMVAANIAGVDVGGFTKRLQGQFTLPPLAITKLCYNCLKKSAHMVFAGEEGVTMLPRTLSLALNSLKGKKASARNAALLYSLSLFEKNTREAALNDELTFPQLLRSRLTEIAEDKGIYTIGLAGTDAPSSLKLCIRKCFEHENYSGRLNTLFYIACIGNHTSLDGLIAPNPVAFTQLCYYTENYENREIITDKTIRRIVSIYYDLNNENRNRLLIYLFNEHWSDSK